MLETQNEYMSIQEISNYLKIKPKTLYAKIREIPHYKVGRLIRFKKDEIDTWMGRHRVQNQKQEQDSATPETEPFSKSPNARSSRKRRGSITDIDRMISKVIDQVKGEGYTAFHGKSDQVKGPGKEV
jgi:excisionase family DNA binding protein